MPKALDSFSRIVCINLDDRPDRWSQIQDEISPHLGAVQIERFSAIKIEFAEKSSQNGLAGCLLSHRGAIEQAYNEGLESVLVLEDDVRLDPDFEQHAQQAIASLQATAWDIFYLGFTPKAPLLPVGDGLVRTYGGLTTHAIAYHRRAIPKILQRLPDASGMLRFHSRYKSIDRFYWQHLAQELKCFASRPPLAFQRDDFSDIQQHATTTNEQQVKHAFDRYLIQSNTPLARLVMHASLKCSRVKYWVDGNRRALLRPVKAKEIELNQRA